MVPHIGILLVDSRCNHGNGLDREGAFKYRSSVQSRRRVGYGYGLWARARARASFPSLNLAYLDAIEPLWSLFSFSVHVIVGTCDYVP